MVSRKYLIAGSLALLLLVFLVSRPLRSPARPVETLWELNGQPLQLLMARSAAEQYQGLSDRESLCRQCGMLFRFSEARPRTFVMRRMYFPLDMVWFNRGKVVHIDYNAQPEAREPYTPYTANEPIDTVLEINAGAAAAYGIKIGDTINLPL